MTLGSVRREVVVVCVVVSVVWGALTYLKDRSARHLRNLEAEWRWSDDRASLRYCVTHHLRGYEASISPSGDRWYGRSLKISILRDGEECCTFIGHEKTVLTQIGDVLYVTDFDPIATGCGLVAYDLKGRTQLWDCPLEGNPPEGHSCYRHRVNIEAHGDVVVVFGNEDHGRYIAHVDARTGKPVRQGKLPPEGHALTD